MAKHVDNALRRAHEAWSEATNERDWTHGSEVSVLRGFVDEMIEEDTAVAEKFEHYLDSIVAEEEEAESI